MAFRRKHPDQRRNAEDKSKCARTEFTIMSIGIGWTINYAAQNEDDARCGGRQCGPGGKRNVHSDTEVRVARGDEKSDMVC